MFVVLIHYKCPLEEIDKYLSVHREFLDYHYKQGRLVVSGPQKPRTGGVVIATGNDRELVEEMFKEDPLQLAELADYEFIEFTPVKHCESLNALILNTEGKL